MKTLKQLAVEAIQIQDACNPLGLSRGFAEATLELRDALAREGKDHGTRSICQHPIFRLWASKMHDLAGMGLSDGDRYGEAYRSCQALAGQ